MLSDDFGAAGVSLLLDFELLEPLDSELLLDPEPLLDELLLEP